MAFLRSLKNRSFAFLWAGQTISRLGDSVYRLALAWWVLETTGSAVAMGGLFILFLVPSLVFALIGGLIVDRYPRVRLMFASDLLRGGVVITVALLAALNQLELWHVYMATFFFGLVNAVFR
jgi:MFS family permease